MRPLKGGEEFRFTDLLLWNRVLRIWRSLRKCSRSDRESRLLDWMVLSEYTVNDLGREARALSEPAKKLDKSPMRDKRTSDNKEISMKSSVPVSGTDRFYCS